MQKKKSESKMTFPSVGIIKPNDTNKNYAPKTNLTKCRDI